MATISANPTPYAHMELRDGVYVHSTRSLRDLRGKNGSLR